MSQQDINDVEQRGEALYSTEVRPRLSSADDGKFVVIDVESGEYEIDANHVQALERMLVNHNGDCLYSIRIGSPAAYQLGAHNIVSVV